MVVSSSAGTTRDAIGDDISFVDEGQEYRVRLMDRAGLRKKESKFLRLIFFSLRSTQAIDEAHIVFLTVDALSGITRHDNKLAGYAMERGKCLGTIVNKWDLAYESIWDGPVDSYCSGAGFQKNVTQAIRRE